MAGDHTYRRSALLVLFWVLFPIFNLCSLEVPSIKSISSTTALDMHKIKASKLNAAYILFGDHVVVQTGLRLFRVKSGLRLVQRTLLTIILILIVGDVSRNPGPMDISTAESNYSAEI